MAMGSKLSAHAAIGFEERQQKFYSPLERARSIPVYKPHFSRAKLEREYVLQCLDTGWISSRGEFIEKFEKACGDFIGSEFAIGVCNGTVALHLALAGLGIGPGDEVIVPTLTYVASVNAIKFVGATPVFCECDATSWQLDPADVARRITDKTRAIMVVHLYGQVAPMAAINSLAKAHKLLVVEDAAEAFGSRIGNRHAGTFGDVATFSFFGNKTLTTGEGGLVVTDRPDLYEEMKLLKGQYVSPTRTYWHEKVGFNFRMTNIQAAIGLGQFSDLDWVLHRKREIAKMYRHKLSGLPITCHEEMPGTTHNYWMCSILVQHAELRDRLMAHLKVDLIETRPVFYPAHTMPMYQECAAGEHFPISEDISARGINLPSYPDLTDDDLHAVCRSIGGFFGA
jgi:perosamine synthetase